MKLPGRRPTPWKNQTHPTKRPRIPTTLSAIRIVGGS
jgi:hypothetical protein